MECNFIDIELKVRTANMARLIGWLPLQGAAFAEQCRMSVCPLPIHECSGCSQIADCGWQQVFAQGLTADPEALRRHQKPPLPFVISFPFEDDLHDISGVMTFSLVVLGRAISCLDMLLDGFHRLLSGMRTEILQIYSRDYQGGKRLLVTGTRRSPPANMTVLSLDGIMKSREMYSGVLLLQFESPLKLRSEGHIVREFDFRLFFRYLLRRVSALIYYYEGQELEYDFKYLAQQADRIVCIQDAFHFSAAPCGAIKLSGLTGSGRFRGDFTDLLPFLVAGTYVHAGKNAAFGMGRFNLLPG